MKTAPLPTDPQVKFHDYRELDIYKSYLNSKFLSFKHSSYFQVYEDLLSRYRNKKIVFVEIGILNGGSLFMWRDFFGANARIIGIDLNPDAKKWESDGFEIHIGNQADPYFWNRFFAEVGMVDIILDDGGHTNDQQIITAHKCIPNIKDGGQLLVEDTHTSYLTEFGNPSKYSFMSYSKKLVDSLNSRSPIVNVSNNSLKDFVYSIEFFESITSFKVDRTRCFVSTVTSNEKVSSNAQDYRNQESKMRVVEAIHTNLNKYFSFIRKSEFAKNVAKRIYLTIPFVTSRFRSFKVRKYFY